MGRYRVRPLVNYRRENIEQLFKTTIYSMEIVTKTYEATYTRLKDRSSKNAPQLNSFLGFLHLGKVSLKLVTELSKQQNDY